MASSTFPERYTKASPYVRETSSSEETLALAKSLAAQLKSGDWLALVGDLGTGKTVFVRGLGEALKCAELPRSPTFSLVQVHKGRLTLRHVDLYRLGPREVPSLEWEELLDDGGVTVVEWAEKAKPMWPPECLPVHISHQGPDRRRFEFYPFGARAAELIRKLKGK